MNEILTVAQTAARAAAAVHRRYLGRVDVAEWSEKGAADFVSHVDHAAEAVILDHIREQFPDHRMLAEEAFAERQRTSGVTEMSGTDSPAAPGAGAPGAAEPDWLWVVDPLDGTTNYLHGYPAYAVSIGVLRRGVLEAAVVLNSASGDEWSAVRAGGAFLNGERIRVSEIADMARALIGTGFPFKALHLLPEYGGQLADVLRATSGVRRAGSAALDLCHVACGWFDGFWELDLAPWDVAAGTLIVREAGGVVTRIDGSEDVVGQGSLLAGNPVIHASLGDVVRKAAGDAV